MASAFSRISTSRSLRVCIALENTVCSSGGVTWYCRCSFNFSKSFFSETSWLTFFSSVAMCSEARDAIGLYTSAMRELILSLSHDNSEARFDISVLAFSSSFEMLWNSWVEPSSHVSINANVSRGSTPVYVLALDIVSRSSGLIEIV